jgi:hypothetical protein
MNRLQTKFETLDSEIVLTLRIARRDVNGNVVDALSSQFDLTVKDNDDVSECVEALAVKETQTNDWQVSFDPTAIEDGEKDTKHIEIMETVSAKLADETLDEKCGIYYKLLAFDGTSWMSVEDLKDILKEENPDFDSNIEFDPETGDFSADFTSTDYEAHKDRFTDANTGAVEIKFKTVPIVPGSTVAGPITDVTDLELTSGEFKITFVEPEKAKDCMDLSMQLGDTYDGTNVRSDEIEYQIANYGVSATPTQIHAKKIFSNVADCPTTTVLEF